MTRYSRVGAPYRILEYSVLGITKNVRTLSKRGCSRGKNVEFAALIGRECKKELELSLRTKATCFHEQTCFIVEQ